MKRTILVLAAACGFSLAASASAAGPSVAWTKKDMTTAIHALGYPKAHPKKLACKGQGATVEGRYASFRCLATYRHHRQHRFVIAGQGEGGWLCAGKTLTGCKLLRRGFVTTGAVTMLPSLGAAADLAARGWLVNRGEDYQVVRFCEQATTSTWTCPFMVDDQQVTVTLTFKRAKGGYTTAAATS